MQERRGPRGEYPEEVATYRRDIITLHCIRRYVTNDRCQAIGGVIAHDSFNPEKDYHKGGGASLPCNECNLFEQPGGKGVKLSHYE